ncbi:pseudaminic acid cytidylyltransferase, partial [Bacteroides uniformis]
GENTAGLVLSELEVQDLDTQTDWALAEMKYELLHK